MLGRRGVLGSCGWGIKNGWEPLSYAILIKNKLPTQYNSTEKIKIYSLYKYDVVEILMVERHSINM